jgi:hypothetical protein
MRLARTIWQHEVDQADKIVRCLVERDGEPSGWRKILLPLRLFDYLRFRRKHKLTRKNLLFTKQLAFEAARQVFQGKPRAEELRFIEIETKKTLEREKTGFYTEKIRRKQLQEIELLVDHYFDLFNSNATQYADMVRARYQSLENYLLFLNKLHAAEEGVIQATLATMRIGRKKERISWFNRLKKATQKVGMDEAERIFLRG